MKKTKTLIQKVSLLPVEEAKKDLAYQFIYSYRYAYYATSNHLMGQFGTEFYNNGCSIDIEKFKDENKEIFSYDNPILKEITYPEGTDILPLCIKRVESDFEKLLKDHASEDGSIPASAIGAAVSAIRNAVGSHLDAEDAVGLLFLAGNGLLQVSLCILVELAWLVGSLLYEQRESQRGLGQEIRAAVNQWIVCMGR